MKVMMMTMLNADNTVEKSGWNWVQTKVKEEKRRVMERVRVDGGSKLVDGLITDVNVQRDIVKPLMEILS